MKTRLLIVPILSLTALIDCPAAAPEDLLRFTNSDQLHGSFGGITKGPSVSWKRADVEETVDFKTSSVRHVVLRGGRPAKSLESLSHIGLVNGDRIPGTVTAIDEETVTLDTVHSGVLRIPRKQVSIIAPNPLGGRVYYYGPFAPDDWKMIHPSFPDGFPPPAADKDAGKDQKAGENGKQEKDAANPSGDLPGVWEFSGSAWYWQNKRGGTALIRESGLPERSVLRFDIAWKNRLGVAIAFNADFAKPKAAPEAEEDEDDPAAQKKRAAAFGPFNVNDPGNFPRIFGNAQVLQIYSNYMMLFRTSLDKDGNPLIHRALINNNNLRLGEATRATIELRGNRATGEVTLFINDEFVTQWNEGDFVAPNGQAADDGEKFTSGTGFGFLSQADDAPLRISDVVVTEWNGMPDSARSLMVDDRDIILMSSGTDRYSGRIGVINDQGRLLFEGKHGSFQFPLEDVAEIRFARKDLAAPPDESAETVRVRFSPVGSVSGRPATGGGANLIHLVHPIIGELDLSTESAVMLEFNPSNNLIDDWDANF